MAAAPGGRMSAGGSMGGVMSGLMRGSIVFFAALAGATAAVLFSAPRSGGGGGGGPVEIRFVVFGQPFEDWLFREQYARGHERLNPHVRVDYQRFSEVASKYNAWHAIGRGPEVMRMGVDVYHDFASRGLIRPLDAFIGLPEPYGLSEGELAQFPPGLMEELRIDGALYALPEDSAQYGLYYNRAIFEAYNASNPGSPLELPRAGWTWEDLREAGRRLSGFEHGGAPVRPIDMPLGYAWYFYALFLQAGGELFDESGTRTLVDGPAGVRALAFLRTLAVEDGSWTPVFDSRQSAGLGPETFFASGRTAMLFSGSWSVPAFELQNPGLDFGVAPLPEGPAGAGRPAVPAGMVLWAISEHAAHPREGWRMIRWLVTEREAARYWDAARVAPPAHLGVLASEAFESAAGVPRLGEDGRPVPGAYEIPPMPRERFEDRAAWLRWGMRPHPLTGEAPAVVLAGLHQRRLDLALGEGLQRFIRDIDTADASAVLRDVAERVNAEIRAASGS